MECLAATSRPRFNLWAFGGSDNTGKTLRKRMGACRFEKAAEAGRPAISLYRESDHSFYLTASALMALGGFSEALLLIERALAMAPRNLDYRFLLAKHLTKRGDKDRAIALHRDIVAVRPDHAGSHYELAALLFSRRAAVRDARKASNADKTQSKTGFASVPRDESLADTAALRP
jgi:tetratricopeptide (TPR) repeat protein